MICWHAGPNLDNWDLARDSSTLPMDSVWAWMRTLLWQTQTIIVYRCLRRPENSNISLEYLVGSFEFFCVFGIISLFKGSMRKFICFCSLVHRFFIASFNNLCNCLLNKVIYSKKACLNNNVLQNLIRRWSLIVWEEYWLHYCLYLLLTWLLIVMFSIGRPWRGSAVVSKEGCSDTVDRQICRLWSREWTLEDAALHSHWTVY